MMENTTKKQGKPGRPTARRYDEAFKAGAVRLVAEQKRPIKQVAADLGVCVDTLSNWVKSQNGAQMGGAGQNRALQTEIKALKKQVADQQETIEILKKAAAIFTRP